LAPDEAVIAKVGVFVGSVIAGLVGIAILARRPATSTPAQSWSLRRDPM